MASDLILVDSGGQTVSTVEVAPAVPSIGQGTWTATQSVPVDAIGLPDGIYTLRATSILGRFKEASGASLSVQANLLLQALAHQPSANTMTRGEIKLKSGKEAKLKIKIEPQSLYDAFVAANAGLIAQVKLELGTLPKGEVKYKLYDSDTASVGLLTVDNAAPELVTVYPPIGSVHTQIPAAFSATFTDASELRTFSVEGELRGFGFGSSVSDITHMYTRTGYQLSTGAVPLPPRDYDLFVRYVVGDALGNVSGPIETSFTVDMAPPFLTFNGYYEGQILDINTEQVEITGYLYDGHLAQASLNGNPVAPLPDHTYVALVDLMPGENIIVLEATDEFGRSSTLMMTLYRGEPYSGTDPIVVGSSPADGAVIGELPLDIVITHRVPRGVAYIDAQLTIIGSSGTFVTDASQFFAVTANQARTTLPNLPDGHYTINYVVVDSTGVLSAPFELSFIVDTQPPQIIFSNAFNGMTVSENSVILYGRAVDVTLAQVKIDGQLISTDGLGEFTYSWPLALGANSLTIEATDGFPHTTTLTFSITYQQDGPPIISLDPSFVPSGKYTEAYPPPITFTYSDPDGINLDKIEVFYGPLHPMPPQPGSPYSFPIQYLTFFKEFLRVFVLALNPSATETEVAEFVSAFVGALVTPTATYTSLFLPTQVEGAFTAGIYVEDNLGNGAYKFISWEVDLFEPEVWISPANESTVLPGMPSIVVRAYDPSSKGIGEPIGPVAAGSPLPLNAIQVLLNGVDIFSQMTLTSDGVWTYTPQSLPLENDLNVTVTDGLHYVSKQSHFYSMSFDDWGSRAYDSDTDRLVDQLQLMLNKDVLEPFQGNAGSGYATAILKLPTDSPAFEPTYSPMERLMDRTSSDVIDVLGPYLDADPQKYAKTFLGDAYKALVYLQYLRPNDKRLSERLTYLFNHSPMTVQLRMLDGWAMRPSYAKASEQILRYTSNDSSNPFVYAMYLAAHDQVSSLFDGFYDNGQVVPEGVIDEYLDPSGGGGGGTAAPMALRAARTSGVQVDPELINRAQKVVAHVMLGYQLSFSGFTDNERAQIEPVVREMLANMGYDR